MQTPTIHLNGTPRSYLQEQYAAAYAALNLALDALAQTAPNGRDYYVQAAGAYSLAADEHDARLAAVAKVRDDMLALHDAIDAPPAAAARPPAAPQYSVVVGNIGTVYSGPDANEAHRTFDVYVHQSHAPSGRAAGEPVVLFRDEEPVREYEPRRAAGDQE